MFHTCHRLCSSYLHEIIALISHLSDFVGECEGWDPVKPGFSPPDKLFLVVLRQYSCYGSILLEPR